MKVWMRLTAAVLLCGMMPLAMAQERMDDVLRDFRAHGYTSVADAMARLKQVQDAPDATASVSRRETYQWAVLDLARRGQRYRAEYKASRTILQKMAETEACERCRFDVLLADYYALDADEWRKQGSALLQQAETLAQTLDSPKANQDLLAAQASLAQVTGQLSKAIELSLQGSELARKNNDAAGRLDMLVNTISLNANLGDNKRAIAVGKEVAKRAQEIGYQALLARVYLDIGHAYAQTGDRNNQRIALEKGLAYAGDDPDQIGNKIILLNNLADYWLSQPDSYAKTLDYAQQALQLATQLKSKEMEIAPLANIGIAQAGLGQVEAGVAALRKSVKLSRAFEIDIYTIGITQELVRVLKENGRYREALEELQSIISLREKQIRQERETAVLELQEKYAATRKAEEIEKLATQNQLKQAQLEAESWKQRLWVAVAVVLGLGLLMLLKSIKRVRHTNRKLADANAALALQSSTDALTGAFNRRHAQALLDGLQRQREQAGTEETIGLIILDLDLFKSINDERGHAAGDAVLVESVKRLNSRLRQNDVVVRWGGEEFVLVLPHTPAKALPIVARNVLDAIAGSPFEFEGQTFTVTVSLGVIGFPAATGQTWTAALGLADSALYLAKASGRNQAVCVVRTELAPECSEADLQQLQGEGKAELLIIHGPRQEKPAA